MTPPKLMAEDGGVRHPPLELAAIDVQIGAADARVPRPHQHLIRPISGSGALPGRMSLSLYRMAAFIIALPPAKK
jgi:hypothetical protein